MDEVDHFEQGYQEIAAPEAERQAQQDREAHEARKASQSAALKAAAYEREQQIAVTNVEHRLNPPRLKVLQDLGVQAALEYVRQQYWDWEGAVSLMKGPADLLPVDGDVDYPLPQDPTLKVAAVGYELVKVRTHFHEKTSRDGDGEHTWSEETYSYDIVRVKLTNTPKTGLRLTSGENASERSLGLQQEHSSLPVITTKEELHRQLGRASAVWKSPRLSEVIPFPQWKARYDRECIEETAILLERLKVAEELTRVRDKIWKMGQVEAATDPLYSELHYRTYQMMVVNGSERTWTPPKAKPKPTENSQGYQLIHGEGGTDLSTGWNLRYNGIIVTPEQDDYPRGVRIYSFYDGYISESPEVAAIKYKTLFVSPRLVTTARELREQLEVEQAFRDQADQFPEKGIPLKRDAEGRWYYDPTPPSLWQKLRRRK